MIEIFVALFFLFGFLVVIWLLILFIKTLFSFPVNEWKELKPDKKAYTTGLWNIIRRLLR